MIETESHLNRCPVPHGSAAAATGVTPGPGAEADRCPVPRGWRKWIARFGVLGFMFFLIKGLAWLTVPALVAWMAAR